MSLPLRIMQMTHQGDFGGSTNSITYLTGGLADRGHEVWLCCRRESLLYERFSGHDRVQLIPFEFGRSPLALSRSLAIARLAKERSIEIINSHASVDRHLTIMARRLFGGRFRLIHTRRNVPLSSGGRLQGQYYGFGTDRVIGVSAAVADGMIRGGLPSERVSVVHNGLPLERYDEVPNQKVAEARESLGIGEREIVIGVVARRKSQAELLRAMKGIDQEATLLFLGIDRDDDLEALRGELGLPHRVIYGGFRPDILPCYKLLTIYILPSIIEGFSLSILEAMALGLPVICTRAGGNPEAVEHGDNGFLFDPGDTEGLHRAIDQLLKDPDLRIRMGARSAEIVRRFHVNETIRKTEEVYRSTLNGRRHS